MADDSKTEKATPKKRRDERKEGHVFSSKDVIVVVSLLGTFYGLKLLFPIIYQEVRETMVYYLSNSLSVEELSIAQLRAVAMDVVKVLAIGILPLGFISIILAVVATGVQTKFLFAAKSAAFKLSNLSIIKGVKNLFSLKNLIELLKGILKITILCVVLYQLLKEDMRNIMRMMDMNILASASYTLEMVMSMVLKIGLIFTAIAGFDYLYQRWDYEKKIRMSKQEVKEEFKQTEGNPEIKGKIRSLQRSRARNRMMQAVPDADVIIRNPTHFAVALKYDIHKHNAPILVAKGQDFVALKIVEIGEANGVTIIENKPLARGIYASTPLDGEIPAEYYGVVAEILVQVFRKNKKSLE
ncbi:flagellar biosynthesis protein FlhB [Mediterraneibacter agrestimuris]|uniref:flagellar biosynthesis protein FlhB n=1 Tax=Mediterraneibacter agrestimuris TaxID=2941333 RepID=UPI0020404F2D|nr:flagellar biosynthesis protein FlhB [Mediterraneibacter agrestimuris]